MAMTSMRRRGVDRGVFLVVETWQPTSNMRKTVKKANWQSKQFRVSSYSDIVYLPVDKVK
jgi:hypothetical protein